MTHSHDETQEEVLVLVKLKGVNHKTIYTIKKENMQLI